MSRYSPAGPERRRIVAQLGALKRHDPEADTTDLRTELKAAKLADYIRDLVNSAPPLTDEQRERLALLLRGGGQRDAA